MPRKPRCFSSPSLYDESCCRCSLRVDCFVAYNEDAPLQVSPFPQLFDDERQYDVENKAREGAIVGLDCAVDVVSMFVEEGLYRPDSARIKKLMRQYYRARKGNLYQRQVKDIWLYDDMPLILVERFDRAMLRVRLLQTDDKTEIRVGRELRNVEMITDNQWRLELRPSQVEYLRGILRSLIASIQTS